MQRYFFILVLLISGKFTFGQLDTVVHKDLAKALLIVKEDGSLDPVLDVSKYNSFGLFIQKSPPRLIRICNSQYVSLWVDGRFYDGITNGCTIIESESLFDSSTSDTVYLNVYSKEPLNEFRLEEIGLSASFVDDSSWSRKRAGKSHFNDFIYTSLIILMSLLGGLIIKFSNRVRYIIDKAFSIKNSSYELADVRILSPVGLSFCTYLSLLIGFFNVYFSYSSETGSVEEYSFLWFSSQWLFSAGYIFIFLVIKWIVASIVSALFSFGKSFEYQLFDFINLTLIFCIGLIGYFIIDFVFLIRIESLHTHEMKIFIYAVLSLTILFLLWKFVSNYPHRKLLIITYLCATEIIPAIVLIGRFYK